MLDSLYFYRLCCLKQVALWSAVLDGGGGCLVYECNMGIQSLMLIKDIKHVYA